MHKDRIEDSQGQAMGYQKPTETYVVDGKTHIRAARSATKTPMERALANPGSLRKAVDAHCFECQGEGQDPGTWKRVKECPIEKCALHHVRRK